MKLEYIKTCDKLSRKAKQIILNGYHISNNDSFRDDCSAVRDCWEKADSVNDFIEQILTDSSLAETELYAVLSRECSDQNHWFRVHEMFMMTREVFSVNSVAGEILLMSPDHALQVVIPNGRGTSITECAVFLKEERNHFNRYMMNCCGCVVKGSMNVLGCTLHELREEKTEGVSVHQLTGDFLIYNFSGLVAFVEV